MAQTVPMVRAISLLPALRWMDVNGRNTSRLLAQAGLSYAPPGDPLRPIPLLNAGRLLTLLAQAEGPDIPWRIVDGAGDAELALIGYVALGAATPAEAFARIAAALPLFCSHEHLVLDHTADGLVVRHSYAVRFDPETEHLMLQYAVAMADRICAMTGAPPQRLAKVEMPPHPEAGFDHLAARLGPGIVARPDRAIGLTIPAAVAGRRFPLRARDRLAGGRLPPVEPLRGDGTLSGSVRVMILSMLEHDVPGIQDVAAAAGMSPRTLQRRLGDEGTSFSQLLSAAREDQARQLLSRGRSSVADIASRLGYKRQSSLTRAMRQWTGAPPRQYRSNASE